MKTDKYILEIRHKDWSHNVYYVMYLSSITRKLVPAAKALVSLTGQNVVEAFDSYGIKIKEIHDCSDYSIEI